MICNTVEKMTFADFYSQVKDSFHPLQRGKITLIYDCIESYPEYKKNLMVDLVKLNPDKYLKYVVDRNDF